MRRTSFPRRANPLIEQLAKQDPEGFKKAFQQAAIETAKEIQEYNAKVKASAEGKTYSGGAQE